MPGRLWQLDYEVHADSVPGRFRDWERVELSYWPVSLDLRPKAEVASGDVLPYVLRHLGPPVIPGDGF